MIKYKRN